MQIILILSNPLNRPSSTHLEPIDMTPSPPLTMQFLPPSPLHGYDRSLPPTSQPPQIPSLFLSAMDVRTQVFVEEQGVPPDNEFDDDDPRACHWVAFSEPTNLTPSKPIATLRLVPPPHPPHPEPGSVYAADALETSTMPVKGDRATTYHDGREPYIKLGRLAVLKEYRGCGGAGKLVRTALQWARENQEFITKMGLGEGEGERWKGLVCVHAQVQVQDLWARWGCKVDEGMGTWIEEGIEHVGMFLRLDVA